MATAQHHSTLRARNQITLPPAMRDVLKVQEGDEILFHAEPDGSVRLIAARLIPADQAWFWTEEWQQGEREADADYAAGRTSGPMTADEFVEHLKTIGTDASDV